MHLRHHPRKGDTGEDTGLIDLLYIDPPWVTDAWYEALSTDALSALPIASVCAPNSIVCLWAATPRIAEAMGVLAAWGCTYRTAFFWVRQGGRRVARGIWFKNQVETLLIATFGGVTPFYTDRRNLLITRGPRQFEKKPAAVREVLHELYPHARKAELFVRQTAGDYPLGLWIPLKGPADLERLRIAAP